MRDDFTVVMEQGFAWKDGPPVDRSPLKGRGTGCNTLLEDYDYLIVRSDGNLYQCVFFMTEGKPIGNVPKQPLEETLRYARSSRTYRTSRSPTTAAPGAFTRSACGTGCRGYAYLYKGDWLKTDPRCSKTDPASEEEPPYFPMCPIMKLNVRNGAARRLDGAGAGDGAVNPIELAESLADAELHFSDEPRPDRAPGALRVPDDDREHRLDARQRVPLPLHALLLDERAAQGRGPRDRG